MWSWFNNSGKKMISFKKNVLKKYFVFFLVFIVESTSASVVISGTRFILNETDEYKTIKIRNDDPFPNVVQVWTDTGNEASSPESADGPFFITPAVFKIDSKSAQNIRVSFSGNFDSLPNDRESVFYINFLQIPPRSTAQKSDQSHVLLMMRNRMKLFYRPSKIKSDPHDVLKNIEFNFKKETNEIEAINKSPFHASFISAELMVGKDSIPLDASMIPPFSRKIWRTKEAPKILFNPTLIKVNFVNDNGVFIQNDIDLK